MVDKARVRINWTIPAPVIIAIIAQAVVLGWMSASWKSSMEGTIRILELRLTALEVAGANNASVAERVKGVEVQIEGLKEQNQRIETKLDKVIGGGA